MLQPVALSCGARTQRVLDALTRNSNIYDRCPPLWEIFFVISLVQHGKSLGPTRSRTTTLFSPFALSMPVLALVGEALAQPFPYWLLWRSTGADQTDLAVGAPYMLQCKQCDVESCCSHISSNAAPLLPSPRGRAAITYLVANTVPAFEGFVMRGA